MSGGGMDGYETGFEVMEAAAKKVRDINQQIQQQLSATRTQVQNTRQAWVGPASGKYETLMQAWDKDAKMLSDALDGIARGLDSNRQGYQVAEDTTGTALSKITSALETA
jgi:WXG100 family type VII secretion target